MIEALTWLAGYIINDMGLKAGLSKAGLGVLKMVKGAHENVLNAPELDGDHVVLPETQRSADEISKDLQRAMLGIKGDFMSNDGGTVHHEALLASEQYKLIKTIVAELRTVDVSKIEDEAERMAFFINIYNALVIHKLATTPSLKSMNDDKLVWTLTRYIIGGEIYSLDAIEHGILRCNTPHPVTGVRSISGAGDPRLKHVLKTLDPRLHFALNCGAKSCPRISVYTGAKLDKQLTTAAKSFCSQEVEVNEGTSTVTLSKILSWYEHDFGSTVVERLTRYAPWCPEATREKLERLVARETEKMGTVKVEFRAYHWDTNRADAQ